MGTAQDWKALALKFGPGWAIAALLIYFLLTSVTASQKEFREQLAGHISDHRTETQRLNYWMAALCRHTAKSPDEREDCRYQEPGR